MSKATNKLIPELRFTEFKNDGEWGSENLGVLCDVRDGTHDSPKYVSEGYPLITSKNLLSDGAMDFTNVNYLTEFDYIHINKRSKVDIGDILFGMIGTIGNPVIVKEDGFAIKNVALIKSKGKIKQDFLLHQLKSDFIGKLFEKVNAGGILKFIALGIIRDLSVLVPNPNEQQKIASCLSSLDEVIAAHSQKLEALKEHKKGLMQNLFPKEGETVPRLRFKEFVNDGEWVKKTIKDITKVSTGGTPDSTNPDYWNGNIPWMNSGELNNKRIYSVSNFITNQGLDNSSTKLIPPKSILIGLAGQGKTRGTAAINYIELCTNQSIGSIHPSTPFFDSEFLYYKIDSMYDELRTLSAGDGGRGGLNLQIIKEIYIQLPKMTEQHKVASCLSSLDTLITAQVEKIEQLKLHKKALMQGLFPKLPE